MIRAAASLVVLGLLASSCSKPGQDSPEANGPESAGGGDGNASGGELPPAEPEGFLLDDFEDQDGLSLQGDAWSSWTDSVVGGDSVLKSTISAEELSTGAGYESSHALELDFDLEVGGSTAGSFLGLQLPTSAVDWKEFVGVRYAYKGYAHDVRIELTSVTDNNQYSFQVAAADEWTVVVIPFEDFTQASWGASVDFDLTQVRAISYLIKGTTPSESGSLLLDDVEVLSSLGATDLGPADLTIHPPAPPEAKTIDSVAISGPLEALAQASLNKGYNLNLWLDARKFDGTYQYDEDTIAKLAAAGFQSVRLPVDLDLYVTRQDPLEIDPTLFIVLDTIDEWTRTHGLSLTIDYQGYDGMDLSDAAVQKQLVDLWTAVATHFKDNDRPDLFYELLEEPELSAAPFPGPTQAEWTALAERAIEAIRAVDATRPVIFGDVRWYDIEFLVQRTPFADSNIIYAFHFYEPMIFTHEGADWVDMAATKNLPFPYTEERWSEHSAYFGFSSKNPSWQFEQLANYHVEGHPSAMRNRILEVKEWAVEHQVPILCNEFGVNRAEQRVSDAAAYYRALIGVFDELQIPWQHWFTTMDPETGAIEPEIARALGLQVGTDS